MRRLFLFCGSAARENPGTGLTRRERRWLRHRIKQRQETSSRRRRRGLLAGCRPSWCRSPRSPSLARPPRTPCRIFTSPCRISIASLCRISSFSLPNFDSFSLPDFSRFTAPPPRETASVRIPDPVVSAALLDIQLSQKDVQSSEQQNAAVLVSLTQSAANQQADLKRISRQLSALSTQVDALQGAMTPLTTSSIPRPKPRARVLLTSRKMPPAPPPLPKPVGPFRSEALRSVLRRGQAPVRVRVRVCGNEDVDSFV